ARGGDSRSMTALALILSLATARVSWRCCTHSRRSTTAPTAAALRSAWGLSDLKNDRVRLPAPSIARARQQFARNIVRVLANMTSRTCRPGAGLQQKKPFPIKAFAGGEI